MGIPFSPIVRRQRLGSELKRLREGRGMTGRQVIEQLGWRSPSKVTRIERAVSRAEVGDVLDLLDLYGVVGEQREKLVTIAREAADRRALWRAIAGVGDRQRGYAQIESGATLIRQYQQFLIPGLLQTPEYGRVRLESGRDLHEDIEIDIDAQARELRQGLLLRERPPRYETILEEGALRRRTAPDSVMRQQFLQLLEFSDLPNVSIRVLTLDQPVSNLYVPHSSFSLYRFADPDDPTLVVLETLTSDVEIRDQDEVEPYEKVYSWLNEASLTEEDSRRLIRTLVD